VRSQDPQSVAIRLVAVGGRRHPSRHSPARPFALSPPVWRGTPSDRGAPPWRQRARGGAQLR
jgi:hypothetical protein